MISCAMIAGMVPMALGLGQGGEQSAPLGRAVIGGLSAATLATLLILPAIFNLVMGSSSIRSASLHPDDADSVHYAPELPGGEHHEQHGHGHESIQPANQGSEAVFTAPTGELPGSFAAPPHDLPSSEVPHVLPPPPFQSPDDKGEDTQ
jgi:hypothetical protein